MSGQSAIDRSLLELLDDATVAKAIAAFEAAIRHHYGNRLAGLFLFGSRARGDHVPDSDADVAVVLNDEDWDFWREKMALADLAYDVIVEFGADVQGWPVRRTEWADPSRHRNPALVRAMQRDGKVIDDAAA
jgi:predicted nucleotidyltransferase